MNSVKKGIRTILFVSIFSFIIGNLSAQDKEEIVAIATFVQKDVFVKSVSNQQPKKVKKNDTFTVNDEVFTKTGQVDIQIGTIAVIRLTDNSSIKFSELFKNGKVTNIDVELLKGQAYTKVGKLGKGTNFQVSSPSSVAGVRGTQFLVSEDDPAVKDKDDVPTGVYVTEGSVAVDDASSNSKNDDIDDDKKSNAKENRGGTTISAGEQIVKTQQGLQKGILDNFVKEKMEILKTLTIMKEANLKMLLEQKEKNKQLMQK